jgi:addiction module HigA family antidote
MTLRDRLFWEEEQRKLVPVRPPHVGDVIRRMCLRNDFTQDTLADAMGVSRFSINQLINGHRGLTAKMALRLSLATSTTPDFWLNLQQAIDLFDARARIGARTDQIKVLIQPMADPVLDTESET